MRFGLKMMIAITAMLALAFGVCGSVLISASAGNSLSQSQEAAASAHRMILYTLSAVGSTPQQGQQSSQGRKPAGREYEELISALTRLDEQSAQTWLAMRLSDEDGIVYVSRESGVFNDGLTADADSSRLAMLTFRDDAGSYLLQIAGQFEFESRTLYLESVYDLSPVFLGRQYQQAIYRQLFIAVVIIGAAVSWLLTYWMTSPLRKLSAVTRTIASGDLSCRAAITSHDEIGVLAADFNDMTGRLEGNINEMMDTMRRQEEFMGGLAHELKTPLTSIIGYADLLRGHTLSDRDKRDAANYIFVEGRRLEVLSLKLLELIVMKKRDFEFVPVAVGEVVEDAARMLIPVLEKRSVGLTYSCDKSVCMLEPDLFMSLLLNIVDNARKAIDGAGRIAIRSRNDGEFCYLSVSDNGRGIPEEELHKIRDAFYRVDKSRSRAQGGVGLGLRLCDEIAAVHDSEISFESKPGRGTTVTVKLALISTAVSAESVSGAATERTAGAASAVVSGAAYTSNTVVRGTGAATAASASNIAASAGAAAERAANAATERAAGAATEHRAGEGVSYE